jgi:hypothetical protein
MQGVTDDKSVSLGWQSRLDGEAKEILAALSVLLNGEFVEVRINGTEVCIRAGVDSSGVSI